MFAKITYKQVEGVEEFQQRLDSAFDLLFEYIMDDKEGVSASASEAREEVVGYAKN